MKKVTVLVVVLMFAVAAWADQASSSGKASTGAKSSTASSSKPAAAGGAPAEHTMTGCLSGPNAEGAYLLKNGRYRRGAEVGGLDGLKAHVGHKVKLTGDWVKEGSEIGETRSEERRVGKECRL